MGSRGASLSGKGTKQTEKQSGRQWGANGKVSYDNNINEYHHTNKEFINHELRKAQRDALTFYTGHGDEIMNAMLRYGGGVKKAREITHNRYSDADYKRASKTIKEIKSAMEKSKSINNKHVTLYRGTGLDEFDVKNIDGLKKLKGRTMYTEGFYSTSTDKVVAERFHRGVIVYVSKPKGTAGIYIESVSQSPTEKETLLNHNQAYRVDDVKIKDSVGHVYITMMND